VFTPEQAQRVEGSGRAQRRTEFVFTAEPVEASGRAQRIN